MPELPEVETIARQLNSVLVGQRTVGVEVKQGRSFKGNKQLVVGRKIIKVWRRAKMAIIELSDKLQATSNKIFLLIHLKMTGQLVYQATSNKRQATRRIAGGHPAADWVRELPSKHTRVIVKLNNGSLFFNDQRMFGWMKVVDRDQLEREFDNYGPDIIDRAVTEDYFYKTLQKSRRAVKLVITDQARLAGVGNIYANEGLWWARIDPRRPAKRVSREESNKLLTGLRKVVEEGIKYGGATASDDKFVQATGLGGKYQEHFLAYEREGERCTRCGGVIKKVRLGGRGTYYCASCQL